jgi:3-hydroxy-9,10-secoandrosta-1,3,5(10)-triene-9,17-dione monooxygenase
MSTGFGFDSAAEQALLDATAALHATLWEHAAACEAEGRLHPQNVELLRKTGLFAAGAPRRVGGKCVSAMTMARIGMQLARACPSTAWVYAVSNSNSWGASLAPEAVCAEVFADGVPIVCGTANPSGTATRVAGGYLVDGSWPFSSGCYHSTWGSFTLADKGPDGKLLGSTVYVPMAEVSIEPTWHVAGLKATGSNTVVAKQLFVPEHRFVRSDAARAREPGVEEPSDFTPMVSHFRAMLLSVMVGAAEAALEQVAASSKTRGIVFTTYRTRSDSQVAQRNIGKASLMIETAKLIVLDATRQIDATCLAKGSLTFAEQAQHRGSTCFATELLTQAMDMLMFVAGASAFMETSRLQRYWRDLRVAASHALNVPDLGYEIHGRALLHVEPNITPSDTLV